MRSDPQLPEQRHLLEIMEDVGELPVGRLLVMPLPLMFTVQEALLLRGGGGVWVLRGQCGRMAELFTPARGRRGGAARLFGALLGRAVHQVAALHAVLGNKY